MLVLCDVRLYAGRQARTHAYARTQTDTYLRVSVESTLNVLYTGHSRHRNCLFNSVRYRAIHFVWGKIYIYAAVLLSTHIVMVSCAVLPLQKHFPFCAYAISSFFLVGSRIFLSEIVFNVSEDDTNFYENITSFAR